MEVRNYVRLTFFTSITMLIQTLMVGTLMASEAKAGEFAEKHPRRAEVNERIRNERKRIKEGLKSGALTPAQAKQLEGELNGVKADERAEVKANGGYLTKTEQKQLNQELNQDSRQIFDEKHPRRAEVNARIANERKRIAEGLKSGELTPAQAKTLEGELNGVKAEERAEVKTDGGYLTKTDQKQLNQELNQDSRQIYAEKHPSSSSTTSTSTTASTGSN